MNAEVPEQDPKKDPGFAVEFATFAGTLVVAFFSGWQTKDLIWSLWLSSLSVGFASVLVSGGRRIFRQDATPVERILSSLALPFAIVFFAIHFGSFHYIYAAILDLLMPLMDHPDRVYVGKLTWKGGEWFSFWETLGIAVLRYWPVAVLSIVRDRKTVLASSIMTGKEIGPYVMILKLHFIIMGLGAAYAVGLESFPVYATVYTLLYSPKKLWKMIFRRTPSPGKDTQPVQERQSESL